MHAPSRANAVIEPRIDSGIETTIMMVEPQLPRNSRIMILVSTAAMAPSSAGPLTAARTKTDWSLIGETVGAAGQPGLTSSSWAC